MKKEIENIITRLKQKAEKYKEQEDLVTPGRRKPRKRKKTKLKKVEREKRENDEEKRVREGESLISKGKPTPGKVLHLKDFMSKFRAAPDLKSTKRPVRKSTNNSLIEGQLRLVSRRGSIMLSRPGKGLKGKFELQEPGGKIKGGYGTNSD